MASDWVTPADPEGPQRFVCLVVEPNGDRSSHSSLYHVLPYNGNPLALSSTIWSIWAPFRKVPLGT